MDWCSPVTILLKISFRSFSDIVFKLYKSVFVINIVSGGYDFRGYVTIICNHPVVDYRDEEFKQIFDSCRIAS